MLRKAPGNNGVLTTAGIVHDLLAIGIKRIHWIIAHVPIALHDGSRAIGQRSDAVDPVGVQVVSISRTTGTGYDGQRFVHVAPIHYLAT